MTVGMLGAMVAVISIMLAVIYRFMRQSIQSGGGRRAHGVPFEHEHEIRTP